MVCGSLRVRHGEDRLRRSSGAPRKDTVLARVQAPPRPSRLKRLYDAIENGVTDLSDLMLKDRIAELKVIRDQARADAERAEGATRTTRANVEKRPAAHRGRRGFCA
jgi:hypothetical protein